MTENQAKRQLEIMLETLTPGSVLHLLGDLFRQQGDQARRAGERARHRRCQRVESTLVVVGMGIDAAFPH